MKTVGALAFVGVCCAIAMAEQTVKAATPMPAPTESKTSSSGSSSLEGYGQDDYFKGRKDEHDDNYGKKDDYSYGKKDDYSYGKKDDYSYGYPYNGGYSSYGDDYNVKCDSYGKGGYGGDDYYQPSYDYYSYNSYGRPSSYGYGGCKKDHKKQRRCRSSYSYYGY